MKIAVFLVCLGGAALAGCSALPTAGPTVSQVFDQAVTDGQRHFDIVDVDNQVVTTLLAQPVESFHTVFRRYGKPPAPRIGIGDTVEVTIAVHNESQVDGEATAFLFVRDPVASVARPLLELKGVQKVDLKAGERKDVTWRLPVEDLSFVGNSLDRVLESGRFEIHIGQSADPSALVSCAIELAK